MSSVISGSAAQELVRQAIIEQARELEENLNLRQLLEAQTGEVLFVEGFAVTDIYFPPAQPEECAEENNLPQAAGADASAQEEQPSLQGEKRSLRTWLKRLFGRILRFLSFGAR